MSLGGINIGCQLPTAVLGPEVSKVRVSEVVQGWAPEDGPF